MDWKHVAIVVGIAGFLASFLLGILVERAIEATEIVCQVRVDAAETAARVQCLEERRGSPDPPLSGGLP